MKAFQEKVKDLSWHLELKSFKENKKSSSKSFLKSDEAKLSVVSSAVAMLTGPTIKAAS